MQMTAVRRGKERKQNELHDSRYVGKGNYYCSNKECSFCMWEDNKFFTSKKKKLTKKIAAELLDKGWCRVTGLYTPKRPQLYDAVIRLDDTGGKYVSFKMEFDR